MKIGNKQFSNKWLVAGVIVLLALVAGVVAAPYMLTSAPAEGLIKVRRGTSTATICDSVRSIEGDAFGNRVATLLGLMNADLSRRQGAYRIDKGMSPFKAARYLKNGPAVGIKFTFNNVRTIDEWCDRWGKVFMGEADDMRKLLKDSSVCAQYGKTPQQMPCLLIPDTYEFYWDIEPAKMLERMHDYYEKFWTTERQNKAQQLGITPDQAVTLASIVEEETSKADERGKVARLYLNRLHQGMKLQADPTVKFAIGDFSIRRLTVPMTFTPSPYNTYRVEGLPPGPIRLPEKTTVDAVLNAPQHDYIYMCAKEDFSGYHNFARDYGTHMANAHRYQAALNARGIK